jgi:(p)ppGpp synthase/HD superfamily hydrolase
VNVLSLAIALAAEYHSGQIDKAGLPYILHPLRVMLRMDTSTERAIAVLHDVIEDCGAYKEDLIRRGIPIEVALSVVQLSRAQGEAYDRYIMRICAASTMVKKVKLADLEDNMDLSRIAHLDSEAQARMRKYGAARRLIEGSSDLAAAMKGEA